MLHAQVLGKRSNGIGGSRSTRHVNHMRAAVRARASPKAVCLGEALFDMLADQKGKPKAEVDTWTGYPGGAPCNVAAGLGQLNIPVAFISALGKDDMGNQLFALLASRSVDMSSVEVIDAPTRDVYVVRTLEGDRTFDSFGQDTNTYCDCFINPDKLPVDAIQSAEVLVMGTLGLAYPITGAAMNKAAEAAKAAGTAVLIDVNWRPVFWPQPDSALETIVPFVHKADIVKMTDEEVEWAFGIPAAEAIDHPEKVLEKLPNAKIVLVTAGSGGAAWSVRVLGKGDVSGFVPVYDVDVQDTTGAGDAFTCGFLAFMLAEEAGGSIRYDPKDVEEAVKFGAACGALTTTGSGAIGAQPHMEEILALLEEVEKKGQSAAQAA